MSTKLALEKFAKQVVKESKTALTKKKKNTSKKLYDSIGYNLNVSPNSFSLSFTMEDYGEFINDGVKGVNEDKTTSSGLKLGNKKFKYKAGIQNRPSPKHFDKWVVKKGIAPRNSKGKFINRDSIKFAIASHVQSVGLETTNFFTKPFESAFKSLPDELVDAFGLEVENLLKFTK